MNQEMRSEARRAVEEQHGVLQYLSIDPVTQQEQLVEQRIQPRLEQQLRELGIELYSDVGRFIELCGDLQFVGGDLEAASQALQIAESQHIRLKEQIKTSFTGGKRTQQLQREGTRWTSEQSTLAPAVELGQQLHNRIIDAFIQEFILSGGGISRLPVLMEEVRDAGLIPDSQLQILLEEIAIRATTIERSRMSSFGYKTEAANLRSAEQSQILSNLLQTAYGESGPAVLQHIARGLLRTMANQVGSLYGPTETTPLSAFAYDVLFAARQSVDQTVFTQTLEWMVEWLENLERKNGAFSTELAVLGDRASQEMTLMQEKVLDTIEELGIDDLADERLLDRYSPLSEQTPFTVGTYYERYNGLEVAF